MSRMSHQVTAPAADPSARPDTLTLPQLQVELLGLAGHLAAAQCRFLRLLAEFDRRGGWAGPGMKSCAHWLSWKIGMSLRTAHEHIRVAHALRELPRVDEAFAAGRVSYSKVRAITRICGRGPATGETDPDSLRHPTSDTDGQAEPDADGSPYMPEAEGEAGQPEVLAKDGSHRTPADPADPAASAASAASASERTLLDLALAGTASHVETVVRAARRLQDDPTRLAARRSVSWRWSDDGSLVLRARLAPAEGAALIAAIDALAEPLRTPVSHPVADPPEDWEGRAEEEAPGTVVDRVAARRADALLHLATALPRTDVESGGAQPVRRGQAQVIVHIDATAGTAAIAGGPEISLATAERLACDAHAQVLLEDTAHNRLYLGRRRRLASPAQIAALTVRDSGRCQFAACTHNRHLHAHHVRPWLRGGRTDIDNLVLICGFHHALVHDRGYRIRRGGTGWETHRPDGTPVPVGGAPLTGNVESLIEIHTRAALRIPPTALTPTWAGERLDPTPILARLLPPGADDEAAA